MGCSLSHKCNLLFVGTNSKSMSASPVGQVVCESTLIIQLWIKKRSIKFVGAMGCSLSHNCNRITFVGGITFVLVTTHDYSPIWVITLVPQKIKKNHTNAIFLRKCISVIFFLFICRFYFSPKVYDKEGRRLVVSHPGNLQTKS